MTLDIWILATPRTITTLMDLWERGALRPCDTLGACALVALQRGVEMAEFAWNTPRALVGLEPVLSDASGAKPTYATPLSEYLRGVHSAREAPEAPEAPEDGVDLFLALPAPLALRVDNARVTSALAHLVPRVPPRAWYAGALVAAGARSLAREHAGLPPVVTDLFCPEEEDA